GMIMRMLTDSELVARYAETLKSVVDEHEEVVVTRAGGDPVVIVALDEYESLKETAYLLRSPENARRLLSAIDRLEHGGGRERQAWLERFHADAERLADEDLSDESDAW